MSTLTKAVLEELGKDGKAVGGTAVAVQFNPTSLKLQMTNSTDGAASRGRQAQQYNGSASTTLSVQLEFDTADEGTTSRAVDVRTRTAQVARFVLPGGTGSKQAPPRVQFRWGTVIVGGVMTSMSEELTLFSARGVPLRASVSVEIKQQDPKFEALERGPGANPDRRAPAAGQSGAGAGPGTAGGGGDRTAEALDGESAADFLNRNGLAPAAWRAIAGALDDPLSLSAGLAVDFSASLSVEAGIGVSLGFGAELGVSAGVSLGLEAAAGAGLSAGLALAGAGGVTAAAEALAAGEAAAAAGAARASFAAPAAPAAAAAAAASAAPAPAADPRAPLRSAPTARTLSPVAAAPRPLPPRADPRATSFGRGVPLRDRVVPPEASSGTGGWVVVAPRPPAGSGPAGHPAGTRAAGGCGGRCGGGGRGCGGCRGCGR